MEIKTAHIKANEGDFAKTVLMPGDPLRAKFIAENFLEDAKLISSIRNIYAYTGKFKGEKISVMASGMGMPSMGIYSYELFDKFGVERIIRIGTAGAINKDLELKDIVVAMGTCTNSNYASQFNLDGTFAPICNYELLQLTAKKAEELNLKIKVGNIISSDIFYNPTNDVYKKWRDLGVLAVEMEAAALYINAAKFGKQALAICTISDKIFEEEYCSAEEREKSFTDMMKLALNIGITY